MKGPLESRTLSSAQRLILALTPAAVILLLVVFSYSLSQSIERDRHALRDMYGVEKRMQELLTNLNRAESLERSYLLTGDKIYSDSLPYVQHEVRRTLRALQGNGWEPSQSAHMDSLTGYVIERLRLMDEKVSLRRAGEIEEMMAEVRTGHGRRAMELSRQHLDHLETEHLQDLRAREIHSFYVSRRLSWLLLGGAIIIVPLALWTNSVFVRYGQERDRLISSLKKNQEEDKEQAADLQALNSALLESAQEKNKLLGSERELRERLFNVLDSMNDALVIFDQRWRYILVNRSAEALLGKSRRELLGRVVWEVFPKTKESVTWRHLSKVGRDKKPLSWEEYFTPGDRWFELRAYLIPEGVACFFIDRTFEKKARSAIAESEEKLRLLVDASPEMMWQNSIGGEGLYYNKRFRDYTGLEEEELVKGEGWKKAIHPEDRGRLFKAREWGIAREEPYTADVRLIDKDGESRWHRLQVMPARNSEGKAIAWIGAAADIDAVVEAHRAADEANQAKSHFLAAMSHEIRTPMNAILGYLELMESGIGGELSEQHKEYAERIKAGGNHLLELINDILDLAKVEAGEMRIERTRVNVAHVVQEALSVSIPLLEMKGLSLSDETDLHCDLYVWGDQSRIRQILVNLLSNAIKFTQEGSVCVKAHTHAHAPEGLVPSPQGPWIAIEVSDTGIGIESEMLPIIFNPFVQTGEGRKAKGTGLGLSISRNLSNLMGGALEARSEQGKGSSFTLWLRAAQPEDENGGSGEQKKKMETEQPAAE